MIQKLFIQWIMLSRSLAAKTGNNMPCLSATDNFNVMVTAGPADVGFIHTMAYDQRFAIALVAASCNLWLHKLPGPFICHEW
jgi:hypothetical protein